MRMLRCWLLNDPPRLCKFNVGLVGLCEKLGVHAACVGCTGRVAAISDGYLQFSPPLEKPPNGSTHPLLKSRLFKRLHGLSRPPEKCPEMADSGRKFFQSIFL